MAREIAVGDEVAVTATIIKLVDGRASVTIPGYNFPHSVMAPEGSKVRDQVELTGEVKRVDPEDGTVTVALPGGRVTIPAKHVRLETKYRPPTRRKPLIDRPD